MRICIQLGYHKKPVQSLDPVTEQVQRRLFWCCYVQERFAACNLGRPIMVSDSEITVEVCGHITVPLRISALLLICFQMPDEICLDATKDFPTSKPGVHSEVSVLIRQAELRRISAKVRSQLYAPNQGNITRHMVTKEALATDLEVELEQWQVRHADKSIDTTSSCLFDTVGYMDINLYRERLFIFTPLAFPSSEEKQPFIPEIKYLRCCLDAAVRIVHEY